MTAEITGKIIGAAIEAHRHLGAGLLETIHEFGPVLRVQHKIYCL